MRGAPSGLEDEGIVANYLVYYLKGGTHLHDFSPYNNHATINGASWKEGRSGWALDFDGVDDYVEVPADPSLNIREFLTYGFWFYPRNLASGTFDGLINGGNRQFEVYQEDYPHPHLRYYQKW